MKKQTNKQAHSVSQLVSLTTIFDWRVLPYNDHISEEDGSSQ